MFKRLLALCCSVMLTASFVIGNNVSAAVIQPDRPTYSYTRDCESKLSFSGSTATCVSSIAGYYNVTTQINVNQILQKKNNSGNWEDVYSWTDTINSFHGTITNSKQSLSSGTYRLKTIFTVYSGTAHETITQNSTSKTI